jgi:hypothetical protein
MAKRNSTRYSKRSKRGGLFTSQPQEEEQQAPSSNPISGLFSGFASGVKSIGSNVANFGSGVVSGVQNVGTGISHGVQNVGSSVSNDVNGSQPQLSNAPLSGGFRGNADYGIASDAAPVKYTPTAMPNKWIGGRRRKSRRSRKSRKSRRTRRHSKK